MDSPTYRKELYIANKSLEEQLESWPQNEM